MPFAMPNDDNTNSSHIADSTASINRDIKEELTEKKATKLGMDYINIGKKPINPEVLNIISAEDAHSGQMIPFYRLGKKLRIALAHPTSSGTLAVIKKLKEEGYALNYALSTEESIAEALKLYSTVQFAQKKEKAELHAEEVTDYSQALSDLKQMGSLMSEMTSEDALNTLNSAIIRMKASDVHIQPEEDGVRVRFRIDGVLHHITTLDKSVYEQLASQLKYQAKLKLNITTVPQDGRYYFTIDGRKIDVRVSAMPTEYGETFVCRFLDSSLGIIPIENLGFKNTNQERIKAATSLTEGMILLTGPTGSGKTTTLYSLLNSYNDPSIKIITLEDPIEYHIPNISQSQINEKRGYTFASGLKTILRQDPDVVMIGEIRDQDTAQTAAQAALTGHVVLSTLHTNSAVESIPRIINMGVAPFVIAPALHTIIAQRLVRKVCPSCSAAATLSESEKAFVNDTIASIKTIMPDLHLTLDAIKTGKGCDACNNTGYQGRINIAEVLVVDTDIKNLILNQAPSHEIFALARQKGMLTLQEDGLLKFLEGLTTIEEITRVTSG